MPANDSATSPNAIARKWLDLAERRIAYYDELYRSGRWQRYFASEQDFAARMLEVIKAAKTFAGIAGIAGTTAARAQDLRPAA
ncbi:MAG: hypothetical protein ACK4UO_05215 [Pseudolabrys sp.]